MVKQDFVYNVPEGMELKYVGPLLCAGITMFSPLNKHVLKKGGNKTVGIVGFRGLGLMGIKLAKAMGCDVTVFLHCWMGSTTPTYLYYNSSLLINKELTQQ